MHEQGQPYTNHTALLNLMFKADLTRLGLRGEFPALVPTATASERQATRDAIERLLEKAPAVLLVAEGVSTYGADELEALRRWFDDRGFDIRVLCTVRHLGAWLHSMVGQRVTGPFRLSIGQAVREFAADGSIVRRRLETLRAVFPGLKVRSHESSMAQAGGPVGAFLDEVGIRLPGNADVVRANEGRSNPAVRALSILNEKFGPYTDDGALNPRVYQDPAVLEVLKGIEGPKFRLGPHQAAPLLDLLRADNEWLREQFGAQFHDPDLRFPPVPRGWSPAGVARLRKAIESMPPAVKRWMHSNLHRLGLNPPH